MRRLALRQNAHPAALGHGFFASPLTIMPARRHTRACPRGSLAQVAQAFPRPPTGVPRRAEPAPPSQPARHPAQANACRAPAGTRSCAAKPVNGTAHAGRARCRRPAGSHGVAPPRALPAQSRPSLRGFRKPQKNGPESLPGRSCFFVRRARAQPLSIWSFPEPWAEGDPAGQPPKAKGAGGSGIAAPRRYLSLHSRAKASNSSGDRAGVSRSPARRRWENISYRMTAAATETLRLCTIPCMGM